jgi:CheY-like chemotaxis protein
MRNAMPKALVVDDDTGIIEILRLALEKSQFDVVTATSGPEALEIARSEKPDVILLDMMMPGMDGSEVYEQLRKRAETSGTPVVAISGSPHELREAQSIMDEASDTLLKTDGIKELLKRIDGLLNP